MKRNIVFLLVALLLITPWPVAYAYGDGVKGNTMAEVTVAEPAMMPKWNAYGNAIGSVIPGDLFYVSTSNTTADASFILFIANTDELVQSYRYIMLNIGIYMQMDADIWEKVTPTEYDGSTDTYLTMSNGNVCFTLPGYGSYKITIDRGCFYCYGVANGRSIAVPEFYLTMR